LTDRTALLHVGTHKTGTTAIQAYMSQCRDALSKQGIHYPSLRPGLWKEMDGHHKVAQALARFSVIDRFKLGRFRQSITAPICNARTVVLSAEPIYRHILGDAGSGDLSTWFAAHRRYLDRLAVWLTDFNVRPIVYFRQPEDLAVSLFKEHVVRRLLPSGDPSFSGFLDATAHYYSYADHVAALADTFGDVTVRDYAAAHGHGLQADFAALIGAAGLPAPARVDVRQSQGNRATLWLAAQPARLSRRDHVRRVLFSLRVGPDGPFHTAGPTTLWPDRATFESFVGRHHAAWALPFIRVPSWPDLPTTTWASADHARAEAEFREWESRHMDLLRLREARKLGFFEPDPA
jgi:hypothetical protein